MIDLYKYKHLSLQLTCIIVCPCHHHNLTLLVLINIIADSQNYDKAQQSNFTRYPMFYAFYHNIFTFQLKVERTEYLIIQIV